jgi:two-component system, cell cycle sensor histidine kinase and response regulator CckA
MAAARQNRRPFIGAAAVAAAVAIALGWLLPAGRDGLDAAALLLAVVAGLLALGRRRQPAPLPSDPAPPLTPELCDQLFEELPVGVVRLDPDGAISAYNRAFADMVEGGSLKGRDFLGLVNAEERPLVAASLDSAEPMRAQRPVEAPLADKRRIMSIHVGGLPGMADPQGRERLLHIVDVTAFKELESQIAQSRKMQAVGQLAGGIAHDFNNLLTAMIGFCDLLLQRHRAGDHSFADIMQIKQNANRAASLVRQLLAFSRQQTLRPKILDVTDTLAELSHLLRRLIGRGVVLKMIHGRDLGLVCVDQSQFEQVVINLAVNARDAMEQGGTLTIQTRNITVSRPVNFSLETMPPGDYVMIEVIDSGSGIPEEVLARIFEPFFTTKPVGMGTGLGLSTVYGIVRQTGGFVGVDSKVGDGTTFTIYLPRFAGQRSDEPATEEADSSSAETPGSGTILLVEDEDPVRLFTARALRNKGYRVVEAKSGEAALQLLQEFADAVDLMITDAVMPGLDGPALVKLVREQRPGTRFICISGPTNDALRERINQAGDISFLPKPFSLKQLVLRVKEVMSSTAPVQ